MYKRRTSTKTDGCATFFRADRFRLRASASLLIDLFRGAASSLLNRDNVAQLLVLDPLPPSPDKASSAPAPTPKKRVGRDLSHLVPNVPVVGHASEKAQRAALEIAQEWSALGVDVESKTAGPHSICLVNTHLLFNPRRRDVRLAQLSYLLAELERSSRIPPPGATGESSSSPKPMPNPRTCDRAPVFMCGDMNLEPGWPEHRFVVEGRVELLSGHSWRTISPRGFPLLALGIGVDSVFAPPSHSTAPQTDEVELIPLTITSLDDPPPLTPERLDRHSSPDRQHHRFSRSASPGRRSGAFDMSPHSPAPHLSHMLRLASAYEVLGPALEGPAAAAAKFLRVQAQELTSFHTRGFNMVDYIFYSPIATSSTQSEEAQRRVRVKSVLLTENMTKLPGLPSRAHPSDHVPLATRFLLDY